MINPIETERLLLRQWIDSDIEAFTKINGDEEVMRFFPRPYNKSETIRSVEYYSAHIAEHGFGMFAVDEKSSNSFIGFIGIAWIGYELPFTPAVEIGWRLDKSFWGKGLATEGALKCLELGFQKFELNKIASMTALVNQPSERVMQKIGMERRGEFDHPKVPIANPLCRHVWYEIDNSSL